MLHRLYTAIAKGSGRRGLAFVLTLAAATGGVIAIIVAITSQQTVPQPPPSAAGTISSYGPTHDGTSHPHVSGRRSTTPTSSPQSEASTPLTASVPSFIDVPAIAVHSAVISIGKAPDGTLAVPQPGPNLNKAAWYRNSVTPGQDGPSVIEGHVDSVYGPSVFFRLGALRPGDQIKVTRADHSVVHFTVNAVRSYTSHGQFPTIAVYGGDLSHSTLRLITCSNFNDSIGHYVGNTVVFAHLTSVHRAP